MTFPRDFRRCRTRDPEAHSMLDWPRLVSPRSKKELVRARSASGPGHRVPTRLITHAKRGFMEHIARPMHRSAAVHTPESPVRWPRQRVAETLKQCSLSGPVRSGAGRGQNIRCPHARGHVPTFSPRSGTTGHAFCCDRCMREGGGRAAEQVERSAVMIVSNVAGPGNRAPPRTVQSVESDSLASLTPRSSFLGH